MEIPEGFPTMEFPEDNKFTKDRWLLGKMLFYNKSLSVDESISCGSCHKQEFGFADNLKMSSGVKNRTGTRNSPTLANIGYHPYFTREGGVPSLEMQVLVPLQEHNEFDFNIILAVNRLSEDSVYQKMSRTAYDRNFDAYVLTRAIATFERSLISGGSLYDKYINGDPLALSSQAIKGMDLFFSEKTQCATCHSGFNFSNYSFENNGLYENYNDVGRYRLTGDSSDLAKFKIPSLRNVEYTAPYMHDGSINTLESVIDHYNTGGKDHDNKSDHVRSLDLSQGEKEALLEFLYSLSDPLFIANSNFK